VFDPLQWIRVGMKFEGVRPRQLICVGIESMGVRPSVNVSFNTR